LINEEQRAVGGAEIDKRISINVIMKVLECRSDIFTSTDGFGEDRGSVFGSKVDKDIIGNICGGDVKGLFVIFNVMSDDAMRSLEKFLREVIIGVDKEITLFKGWVEG